MAEPKSPRQRMIESAAVLVRERGVEATSFSDVLAHSGAPRGSIYHHFPGGKAQLIEEATRYAGTFIAASAARAREEGGGPLASLDLQERFWKSVLGKSGFSAGCPIVAGALEGARTPGARDAAADVFRAWQEGFADSLISDGVEAERARSLAATVISAIEGAVVLCRAQRTMEPLERTLGELRALVGAALPDVAPA